MTLEQIKFWSASHWHPELHIWPLWTMKSTTSWSPQDLDICICLVWIFSSSWILPSSRIDPPQPNIASSEPANVAQSSAEQHCNALWQNSIAILKSNSILTYLQILQCSGKKEPVSAQKNIHRTVIGHIVGPAAWPIAVLIWKPGSNTPCMLEASEHSMLALLGSATVQKTIYCTSRPSKNGSFKLFFSPNSRNWVLKTPLITGWETQKLHFSPSRTLKSWNRAQLRSFISQLFKNKKRKSTARATEICAKRSYV